MPSNSNKNKIISFKSKEFKDLKKTWYKKLKQKGFDDIEKTEHTLRLNHAAYFADQRRNSPVVVEGKQTYYRLAGQFLYDHKFKDAAQKLVWSLHVQGKKYEEITRELKKKKHPKSYKDYIQNTIQSLATEMLTQCSAPKQKT